MKNMNSSGVNQNLMKFNFECFTAAHAQRASEKHVNGHWARAQQRKAAKELRKTSKWAVRELQSLEALHQRFTQDAQEALCLERWLPTHPAG